ncbi:MAG: hypothetical protein M1292_03370 [Bacteroidetes bacterium]|nr:hypothetical protein [Bacteroidota bacterium]
MSKEIEKQLFNDLVHITIVTSLMTKLILSLFCPEGINIHRKNNLKKPGLSVRT